MKQSSEKKKCYIIPLSPFDLYDCRLDVYSCCDTMLIRVGATGVFLSCILFEEYV